jgi:hypothetical protein
VFVAGGQSIFLISATSGFVTTYVGTPDIGSNDENIPASDVFIEFVERVSGDSLGNVYYIDFYKCRIRKVLAGSRLVSTVVGSYCGYNGENTTALSTRLDRPSAIWLDTFGNIIIGDSPNRRIRKFTVSTGLVTTIAGTGEYGFSVNLPATSAMLRSISNIVGDTNGNIYFSDPYSSRVMKITSSGFLVTYLGGGPCCSNAENLPATSVYLLNPTALQIDSSGNLFVHISSSSSIVVVDHSRNLVTTFMRECDAGIGIVSVCITGTGTDSIWIDTKSNIYLTQSDYRIIKVALGTVTTVAGNAFASYAGDGGPANSAQLWAPGGSFADTSGNVYIADKDNCRVRLVDPAGIISTIGGMDNCHDFIPLDNVTFSQTSLSYPSATWKDTFGNLYVTEQHLVRKVEAVTNIVTTIAVGGYELCR